MRKNLKPYVVTQLQELNVFQEVAPEYPEKLEELPMVVYQALHSPKLIDLSGDEVTTSWRFVLEIVGDKTAGTLTPLTSQVQELFSNIGFDVRIRDANTPDYIRSIIEMNGTFNNYLNTMTPN
ncbi:MAG: hypothetical protein LBV67_11200 [Streptococcaceae bacterium]|jgi:hypothetical protein|nr:hypothetical protein [Streptococcaceae bacterium]